MNLDLGGLAVGGREAIVLLIVGIAAYMVFVLLRMRRLRGREDAAASPALPAEPGVAGTSADAPQIPGDSAPEPEPAGAAAAWEEAPEQLARGEAPAGQEGAVVLLREEVDALRSELAALRRELHAEIAHMRASQTVSPLYNDAMQMATAGHDPAAIAEHCGISRAEADLVVALVHGQRS